jgi:septum formation protein
VDAPEPRLVLASSSPRRAQILRALGVVFRVRPAGVDETLRQGEDAVAACERLARAKAEAGPPEGLPVLAADTLVVCDGRVLGKPASQADAGAMLRKLSGRTHEVVTGVALRDAGRTLAGIERSEVTFTAVGAAEIEWYVSTGEPMDKAGGYHVDGRGALFVESIEGSPSNVAGLPVLLLRRLCREAGLDLGLGPISR